MFLSCISEYSPTEFAVSHYGPEGEYTPKEQQIANPQFQSEKQNMILRMLGSEAFLRGRMSFRDIAKLSQVQVKLVRQIHRSLKR